LGHNWEKKINQENDKNIAIKRMRTKKWITKTNAIKLKGMKLQKKNNQV